VLLYWQDQILLAFICLCSALKQQNSVLTKVFLNFGYFVFKLKEEFYAGTKNIYFNK